MNPARGKHGSIWNLIFLVAFVPLLTSCAELSPYLRQMNLVSVQEEVQLGRQMAREIEKQKPLSRNSVVVQYVRQIGQTVVRQVGSIPFPMHFYVIDDPKTVNAFTAPGGHIYVYTGLLLKASNQAEVAGVVAHEIGHAVRRHPTRRLTQVRALGQLQAMILGESPGEVSGMVTDLLGGLGIMSFGREDEYEADEVGVRYLHAAGFEPTAMISFFQKLRAQEGSNPSEIEVFFRTHPPSSNRIVRLNTIIQGLSPLPSPIVNTSVHKVVQTQIR